jgi:dTDP-4-amino-4,6-dideoxygalactose transaminase
VKIREVRTKNFEYLHKKLSEINNLNLRIPDGPFMYPLYIKNGADVRKSLHAEKIFIPTLWPAVFNLCEKDELEYDMAMNILPLPCDQRYDLEDMQRVVDTIKRVMGE